MVSCAALIPARGGSQRIPRKNIRDFVGKPALTRLIQTLQKSQVFDSIYVSTDDEEIADIATFAGALVPFKRPSQLSDNYTGARAVINHAIETLQLNGSYNVGVFYPTAVLLTTEDVKDSNVMFQNSDADFLLSVAEYPAPISRALSLNEQGFITPTNSTFQTSRTQDLPSAYYDLGQFYWGTAKDWLTNTAVVNAKTQGFIIDSWRAVDIDTLDDWYRAELMYRVLHEQEQD